MFHGHGYNTIIICMGEYQFMIYHNSAYRCKRKEDGRKADRIYTVLYQVESVCE